MHIHPPKPLHGWRVFFGEVGIVVLGIMIALALEQIVEFVHWRHKAEQAHDVLKAGVAEVSISAYEQQFVSPCVDRQLEMLEQRLFAPGGYRPPKLFRDAGFIPYVVRAPSRQWDDSTWRIVTSEGTATHLAPALRRDIDFFYRSMATNNAIARQLDQLGARLNGMGLPLRMEPATAAQFARDLEEMRAREALMTLVSKQMLGEAQHLSMLPTPDAVRAEAYHDSGTVAFCRRLHLPLGQAQAIYAHAQMSSD